MVSDITYLPFGPIASYTLGNGQTVTRTYDANYRLADLTSAAFTLQIARDTMGQPTRITSNAVNDAATENYSYDPLYRLTAVKDTTGAVIETYSYNKTGDRLSKTGRGLATGDYGYQTGTHWLTQIGNTARDYSAAGHTIGSTAGGQSYRYDYTEHRLNAIYIDDGTWWGVPLSSYTYDGFGKRVSKQTGSPNYLNRRFVYNEASQLIGEYSDSYETGRPVPSYIREYLWLDTLPMGVVDVSKDGSVVNYVIADELDTPRAITNASGQTIWYWPMAGNPFGEKQPISSLGYVYNLRFPGQYYDAESGLHYNIHRYYDPTTGRYGQTDPIGLEGGWSTYGYANVNPLVYIDPEGLQTNGLRTPSSMSWRRSPGQGGAYGRGVARQRPELELGPNGLQQTPGAWPSGASIPEYTFRCLEAWCDRDMTACHSGLPTKHKLDLHGQPPDNYPTASEMATSYPNCKCSRWGLEDIVMENYRHPGSPAANGWDAVDLINAIRK